MDESNSLTILKKLVMIFFCSHSKVKHHQITSLNVLTVTSFLSFKDQPLFRVKN